MTSHPPSQLPLRPPPLSALTGAQQQWIGAGYLMMLGSMCGQTIFIAQFNPSLRAEFALSHGEFAGLYTLATLASSVVLVWLGGLADRFEPQRLAIGAIAALCLMGASMALTTHVIWVGLTLFGLRLFGQGMMSHIAQTTMSRWFHRFRGRALAIAQFGAPTGDALVPFLMTSLIALVGWRNAWWATIGFWGIVLLPAIAFLLRDPPDGKRAKAAGYVNPDMDMSAGQSGDQWTRSRVLSDPLFWLIIPGLMGPPAIGTLFLFHQANLVEIKGWDLTSFTAQFAILAATTVVAAMLAGQLIDRFGATRILPVLLVPQGIGCILLGFIDASWVIPLFFISFGTTSGLMSTTVGALWAELYGTRHIGAIRALATSAFVFASALGPGLAGYLIDTGMPLDQQAFFYASFCLVASLVYWLTRPLFRARVAELGGV